METAAGSESPSIVSSGTARILARVLGTFDVVVDRRPIDRADWHRVSAERLMKLLLVTHGHAVTREVAAETLWPAADPDASRGNLRKALHFARTALTMPGAISTANDVILLDRTLFDVDLDRLVAAYDLLGSAGRSMPGDGVDAIGGHDSAVHVVLELGSRPLLPDDSYEDWLVPLRERLRSRWQLVALHAVREAAAAGRREEALAIVERLLEQDPADESAHRLAMELYAAEGRHHAVRRQYEMCRAELRNLDAVPSEETEAVYRRATHEGAQAAQGQAAQTRFVARRRELEGIEPVLDRVASGRSAALVLHGAAGIGKTRLLDEVVAYARASGWRTLTWQAIEATRTVAFAPFNTGLADVIERAEADAWSEPERSAVAMILPRLGITARVPFGDRAALIVGLVAALGRVTECGPYLVAIDDVPWLDDASAEAIEAAVSMLSSRPLLVAVTYRDDEPLPDGATRLVDRLRRARCVDMPVGPLAERDVEALVLSHLGGQSLSPDLERLLFSRSMGNPLYCLELARAAGASGAISLAHGRWRIEREADLRTPPETVRQIVATRWKALPAGSAELLRIIAAVGNAVSYETLVALRHAIGGDLMEVLDEALASGLLVDERGAGYRFAHPLFREAVESDSGTARRAQFHLSIAMALAGASAARPDEIAELVSAAPDPALLAEHALRAAELGLREAAPLAVAFGFAAGLRARALFDRASATDLLSRSLAVWQRLPARSQPHFDASSAWVDLGELRMTAGDEPGAQQAFERSIEAARTPDELATAYDRYLWVPYRHGDFEAAIRLASEAQSRLPPAADVPRAIMRQWTGWCVGRLHRFDEAIGELSAATAVFEASNDRPRLASALDMLGTMLPFVGRVDEGIGSLERSLAIALDLRSTRLEQVRLHLASSLTRAGRPAEARPHARRAIEIADLIGDWYLESVGCWLAAEMEDALGNHDAARDHRMHEISLLERIGGNPHNEALARAHLAHLARIAGDAATEAAEAAKARALAAADPEPGYAVRIEAALSAERWSDLATG